MGTTAEAGPLQAGKDFVIRSATLDDVLRTRTMQMRAMSLTGAGYYSRAEIDSFLRSIGTLEDAVVAEGHVFIALDRDGQVIGSGGWSRLAPCYARFTKAGEIIATGANPVPGVATVRSVFVAPEHARRGVGRAIMQAVEADAREWGLFLLRLTAMLSAERFYRALGYSGDARGHMRLPDGARLGCVRLEKLIAAERAAAAEAASAA
ncbi:MAG TPA: GNAT family N-acetyltransferase [Dongiaceae bacterium]|jgi:GNAT superfamily N-acetyltransferase|nr:GNAT family N-acetyltransferase [Dongiaceae bacterium]